ncbi:MAG: phosphatase PAP2 family protein [Saprospiraceae bacterium]|nr:phosphatase PAP2 family protein [Saprospiraceae bacterium]
MIAYAQIYVGVHYPMDVIFGSLLGIFMGWIGAVFINYYLSPNELNTIRFIMLLLITDRGSMC